MNNLKLDLASPIATRTKTKSFFLIVILLPLLMFLSINFQSFNYAYASSSLGESIQQFQEDLQSSINKQIQSSSSNNNNNNNNKCDSNNNISFQSQTNNNGRNTIISKNFCGNLASIKSASSFSNANLKGVIVSAEYNATTGTVTNSLFGNWSFTKKDDSSNEFNSSFIKQPIFYKSTIGILPNSAKNTFEDKTNNLDNPTDSTAQQQKGHSLISYSLSNFNVNSIIQQNSDTTFKGKMDVVKERKSLDTNHLYEKDAFYNIDASVSILNNSTLIISFDSQTTLSNDFKNIPLVGIAVQ